MNRLTDIQRRWHEVQLSVAMRRMRRAQASFKADPTWQRANKAIKAQLAYHQRRYDIQA